MAKRRFISFKEFQWIVFFTILILAFIYFFVLGFIKNCVFGWPIRWDARTCWNEQIKPASEKSAEKAVDFFPQ
ncbi:hypothetical protein A3H53_01245 [Candidatus Nomurabacteria bacterium RIFCSPLOWO2_02_FULL_40_10]|uniref:Uncharacterized protein n=1 Tax=Candidatus Nomurabacteria bacterium RIFCSPLOWO2_02_FULL_40_10 TaxID=1801786 RepID=A0A1F6XWZ2_9BACT|nr:MAG: hypothetical protein A3H53_01245 [Candidatus Nomurabacteria bacterium RIFCSPLOWO2_02_FULL_40_10]